MKFQELILSAAAVLLLVGAAGGAWAIDCDGIINDEIVGDVTIGGARRA